MQRALLVLLLDVWASAVHNVRMGWCFGTAKEIPTGGGKQRLQCEHTRGMTVLERGTLCLVLLCYLLVGVLLCSSILMTVSNAGRLSFRCCILTTTLLFCRLPVVLAEAW